MWIMTLAAYSYRHEKSHMRSRDFSCFTQTLFDLRHADHYIRAKRKGKKHESNTEIILK